MATQNAMYRKYPSFLVGGCLVAIATAIAGCGGDNGANGAPGATGATGVEGANGPMGSTGTDGAKGATGSDGSRLVVWAKPIDQPPVLPAQRVQRAGLA